MSLKIGMFTIRPGGAQTSALAKVAAEYLLRCGRTLPAEAKVFRTEAALLTAVAEERRRGAAAVWIADPGGASLSSEAFADRIRRVRDDGLRHLILAIGPADGWSRDARAGSDFRLSLGPMTLPHELAALVLAEQIYRACTILQGHPYHLGH